MASNRYEVAGRVRKVQALLGAARVLHLTAETVATSIDARARLVSLAKVNEPSRETWRTVVRHLQKDEEALAAYAAALADGRPMPRTARPGQFREWSERGIVGDRHEAVA